MENRLSRHCISAFKEIARMQICYCSGVLYTRDFAMKLSLLAFAVLFLISICSRAALAVDSMPPEDLALKSRIGGWIGDNVLLVLPDRSAGLLAVGSELRGVRLLEIDDNSGYTLESGGARCKFSLDRAWLLAPDPDIRNWLVSYMKHMRDRIDSGARAVSQEATVRVFANGAVKTDIIPVQQAAPFHSLPEWMESVDFKLLLNPGQKTSVQLLSFTVTPAAYKRLLK